MRGWGNWLGWWESLMPADATPLHPIPDACLFDEFNAFPVPGRPYANIPGWELKKREELLSKAGERMAGELGRVRDEMNIRGGRHG
jgi:hypothetical protein